MDPVRAALLQEALAACVQSWHAFRRSAWLAWLQLDLSVIQLKVVLLLDTYGQLSISQLATTLSIGRPAASILVDHLVHAHLVTRTEDKTDRRRTLLGLTEDAQELVTNLFYGAPSGKMWALEELSDADLSALARGLRALTASYTPWQPAQDGCVAMADMQPEAIQASAIRDETTIDSRLELARSSAGEYQFR